MCLKLGMLLWIWAAVYAKCRVSAKKPPPSSVYQLETSLILCPFLSVILETPSEVSCYSWHRHWSNSSPLSWIMSFFCSLDSPYQDLNTPNSAALKTVKKIKNNCYQSNRSRRETTIGPSSSTVGSDCFASPFPLLFLVQWSFLKGRPTWGWGSVS